MIDIYSSEKGDWREIFWYVLRYLRTHSNLFQQVLESCKMEPSNVVSISPLHLSGEVLLKSTA